MKKGTFWTKRQTRYRGKPCVSAAKVDGYQLDGDSFVFKDSDDMWYVVDFGAGCSFGVGATRKRAIENAAFNADKLAKLKTSLRYTALCTAFDWVKEKKSKRMSAKEYNALVINQHDRIPYV